MTTEPDSGADGDLALSGESAAAEVSILLIANRTCPCPDVLEAVADLADGRGAVHIVAPALNSRLRHWLSDVDDAIGAARERLDQAAITLGRRGIEASGEVGDSDPLRAARDAILKLDPDEIVVSTYPEGDSNWLEQDLPNRLEEALGRPVTHLTSRYGLDRDPGP